MTSEKKELVKKILYFIFWGILTTLLNVGLYSVLRRLGVPLTAATAIAWFLCVLFAFITNKKYVFGSKEFGLKKLAKEFFLFYLSRLFTGISDIIIMNLLVNFLHWNEIVAKITDEVFVSSLNFLFGFLFIFK